MRMSAARARPPSPARVRNRAGRPAARSIPECAPSASCLHLSPSAARYTTAGRIAICLTSAAAPRQGPRRDQGPAAGLSPSQDHKGQRRHREQVHEMFHVRSVAEEVRIGAEQGVDRGGDAGGQGAGQSPADPPDQGDREQHRGDRQQADGQLVVASQGHPQGIEPVAQGRLVLGEVAVHDVAVEQAMADVGISRLVTIERFRCARGHRPEVSPVACVIVGAKVAARYQTSTTQDQHEDDDRPPWRRCSLARARNSLTRDHVMDLSGKPVKPDRVEHLSRRAIELAGRGQPQQPSGPDRGRDRRFPGRRGAEARTNPRARE